MKTAGIVLLNLVCVFLTGAWLYNNQKQQAKTAFIKTFEVYEAFEGKKELQKKLEDETIGEKQQLDSMKLYLEQIGSPKNTSNSEQSYIQNLWKSYEYKKSMYLQRYEEESAKYNAQVWNQINTYVQEYGQKHGYRYIFGATGNGSLMYGEDSENISNEVIIYINNKYQGK